MLSTWQPPHFRELPLNGQPITFEDPMLDWDPYCYVCSRCTDHVAEHDDLLEAGLVDYRGSVVVWTEEATCERVEQWDAFNLIRSLFHGRDWYSSDRWHISLTRPA